ncbi:hypothetical protein FRC11_003469 [Ceratobasidium sp. 423]|nr:hypothetical protein FRC11_003469 [Ceratobasidium sp. 423]
MTRLEGWATETLCKVFESPSSPLAELATKPWTNTLLMRFITFSRNTKLSQPVMTFMHYFISINLKERTGQDKPFDNPNALTCVDIYNDLKDSNRDPVLFGCVFLGLLSLGHRSSIWSLNLSGKDRAIFYAAQAQLIDIANELQIFKWLRPDPVLDPRTPFCSKCKWRITTLWRQCFGELIKGLGSGLPLKDVSLLFSIPQSYWKFHIEWNQYPLFHCEQNSGTRDRGIYMTFLHSLEANIQKMFEELGSRYRAFAR